MKENNILLFIHKIFFILYLLLYLLDFNILSIPAQHKIEVSQ